jgi:hypothetical protein
MSSSAASNGRCVSCQGLFNFVSQDREELDAREALYERS